MEKIKWKEFHEENKYGCPFLDMEYGYCDIKPNIHRTCISSLCPMIYWFKALEDTVLSKEE